MVSEFPPWPVMIAVDAFVVLAALAITALLVLNRRAVALVGGTAGVVLIGLGFWGIALVYAYDGFIMLALPAIVGDGAAMAEMRRLHLNYSWYAHSVSLFLIALGLAYAVWVFTRHLAALREAARQAEQASAAKSRFLATMSHEFRSPLNAIIGFSEAMSRAAVESGPAKCAEYAGYIHQSGQHLSDLVKDILDLARIEDGKVVLREQALDVAGVLESARSMLEERAASAGALLSWRIAPALPGLWADERVLRQIVINLACNAIASVAQGGHVTVATRSGADGGFELAVEDDGPGIQAERLESVFEPFNNTNPYLADEDQGTGLGLAITKALVEAHEGRIELTSRRGDGTTVTVRFPAERVLDARRIA